MTPEEEKEQLFSQFMYMMGAPLRKVELTDENLEAALITAIQDYSSVLQNFLIESQWTSLYGADISNTDMSFALSVRSLDFADQFTYAYSKAVGHQANGPWELKKDFIDIEPGRQVYTIPAGREINQVLYFTPSSIDAALFANYGGFDRGFGGGIAQMGNGTYNTGGYYIAPAYDVLLTAQDLNLKNRMLRSDLTYKLTAGPNGTRLLHLMSVPGSKLTFAGSGNLAGGRLGLGNCRVWYHYYDTTVDNADECRAANPDIILLPNDVPLAELDYNRFNPPTKITIRQLFFAESKRVLATVRGKYSGVVGPQEAERKMDYEMLLTQAKEERDYILTELKERLDRMSPLKMLERIANESEQLNRHLKYRPLGFYLK